MSISLNRKRAAVSRRFIPTQGDGLAGYQLESRALTAPALWRLSPLDPARNDFCTVQADTVWYRADVPYLFRDDIQTVEYEHWESPDPMEPPVLVSVTDVTFTTTATAEAFDLDDPGAPNLPVGNYGVSFDTIATVQFDVTGPDYGVFSNAAADAGVSRNYVLAYDSAGPNSAIYLVEHFSAHLDPTAPTPSVVGGGLSVEVGSPAATFLILTQPNVTNSIASEASLNGVPITATSGPVTVANAFSGGTVTYSLNDTDLYATSVTPLSSIGTLPIAAHGGAYGSIQGLAWSVYSGANISLEVMSTGGDDTGKIQLATHYDAAFTI